jgi:hypothetical protein
MWVRHPKMFYREALDARTRELVIRAAMKHLVSRGISRKGLREALEAYARKLKGTQAERWHKLVVWYMTQ